MHLLTSFISGLIFAIGLSVSGMVNPQKVIGFLNIFGDWDPSLAFVMGGAVLFNFVFFRMILKRESTLLKTDFSMPVRKAVDKNLVFGSILFGIGWGMFGICPGPGLVNLFRFDPKILVFVLAMMVGMVLFRKTQKQ
ncbi:MAG: DUF6691 family protein [Bdellovibrionales bacterium]